MCVCNKVFFVFLCFFFLVLPVYCYQPVTLHPHAHMLSHVTPWTAASQAPLSMDFSRQEYWSGLPFPSPIWNILDEMGIPDLITCLLRNLYAEQEATVRTGCGTTDWFIIGKGVPQSCKLSPCLFNLYAEYII